VTPPAEDEGFHLSPAELSAYVNEDLEELDREDVESHLEVCDQCRSEVERIRASNVAAGWFPVDVLQSRPVQIAALVLLTLLLAGFALWYARNRSRPLQAPLQNGSRPRESHASASPSPVQTPDAPVGIVAQLTDGGKRIVLNEKGELEGVEHLPGRRGTRCYRTDLLPTRFDRRKADRPARALTSLLPLTPVHT
jgi:hypothetical protein